MESVISTDFRGSDEAGEVLPEMEPDTTKEQLEIMEDFYHAIGGCNSMDDVNDALAECQNAREGVA